MSSRSQSTMSKQSKCGACGKFLSGGATCPKCKMPFHKQCVNLTTNQPPTQWLCPCCIVNLPRKDNTNTPVKTATAEEIEEYSQKEDECIDEQQNLILKEIRALRADMTTFRKDFGIFRDEVRDEIKELRETCQGCISKINDFSACIDGQEARLSSLETTYKDSLQAHQNLSMEVYLLKRELQEREQQALQNDLEISGVTELNGENTQHVIGVLMNKIGVKLDEEGIVEVCRVGPVRAGLDGKPMPRPIVLRVTRRALHEQILKAARVRRSITTCELELEGPPRHVYINERLTKHNRFLFNKARTLCKKHNWKFTWVREGKIRIKEAEGKATFRIRSEGDLDRLFK